METVGRDLTAYQSLPVERVPGVRKKTAQIGTTLGYNLDFLPWNWVRCTKETAFSQKQDTKHFFKTAYKSGTKYSLETLCHRELGFEL